MNSRKTSGILQGRLQASGDSHVIRLLVVLITVFLLMTVLSPRTFFSVNTFTSIGYQLPEFGLYALAMMSAMILGGIDLSIVSVGNLAGIFAAQFMAHFMAGGSGNENNGFLLLAAFAISIITGMLCGLLNGFSIAVIGIQPILATLATMQIFSGLAIVITKGAAVVGLPEVYAKLGNSTIFGFLPIIMLLFIVAAIALGTIQNKTKFGLNLYMVGTNRRVADFSGINSNKTIILTYMMGGILSAVAGLVVASRSVSAKVGYGEIYQLQAILAVVLGGVNPSGGFGRVSGVVLAILSLQILSVGVNILRISDSTFIKNLLWGGLLLGVLVINHLLDKRKEKKLAQKARMV